MSIAFSAVTRSKTLASMFAAALIMGGGTAAAAAATGTNPLAFAQQIPVVVQHVPAAVVDCKDQLGSGHHGVGECVSTFVQANRPDSTNTGSTTKLISPSSSAAPSASTHGSEVSTVLARPLLAQSMARRCRPSLVPTARRRRRLAPPGRAVNRTT